MIIALCIVLLDYANGIAGALKRNEFKWSLALSGLKNIVLLAFTALIGGLMFYYLRIAQIFGLPFAEPTFKLLMTLVIAYYGNSTLQNMIFLFGIPTPAFMQTIDDKLNEMFNKSDTYTPFGAEPVVDEVDESEVLG
ncbi:MAG: hypothetical protein HGB31_02885 [Erysipelotrichaceae bacterium]|nr:hypothetical protein [Erysipelotrichaceae bacterium]